MHASPLRAPVEEERPISRRPVLCLAVGLSVGVFAFFGWFAWLALFG